MILFVIAEFVWLIKNKILKSSSSVKLCTNFWSKPKWNNYMPIYLLFFRTLTCKRLLNLNSLLFSFFFLFFKICFNRLLLAEVFFEMVRSAVIFCECYWIKIEFKRKDKRRTNRTAQSRCWKYCCFSSSFILIICTASNQKRKQERKKN